MIEVVRLAEEAGDVGGHRRDHRQALVGARLAFHQGAVIAEAAQADGSQTLGQPRIDQMGLAFGQDDAGFAMHQRRDLAEIRQVKANSASGQRFVRCGVLRRGLHHAAS